MTFQRFSADEINNEDIRFPDCYFYHTTEVPGHGVVQGQWDLRSNETSYLGNFSFKEKTVLEIGCASGYLSFWMESQGARVTGFDLGPENKWCTLALAANETVDYLEDRKKNLLQINNAWKFLHKTFNSSAKYIIGSVYDINANFGSYDVVTLCSILLHLHDPFQAIANAASVASRNIIITEVSEELFFKHNLQIQDEPVLYFTPRPSRPEIDGRYMMTSSFIKHVLDVLGFDVTISRHLQKFQDGHLWPFYTAVGTRR